MWDDDTCDIAIFGSLLTTFEVSNNFLAAVAIMKWLKPKIEL